jgi:hypothetical protein
VEDAPSVIIYEDKYYRSIILTTPQQPVLIVKKRDIPHNAYGGTFTLRRDAERGRQDSVDAARASIRENTEGRLSGVAEGV